MRRPQLVLQHLLLVFDLRQVALEHGDLGVGERMVDCAFLFEEVLEAFRLKLLTLRFREGLVLGLGLLTRLLSHLLSLIVIVEQLSKLCVLLLPFLPIILDRALGALASFLQAIFFFFGRLHLRLQDILLLLQLLDLNFDAVEVYLHRVLLVGELVIHLLRSLHS